MKNFWENKNVLVTGGAGFIGSHVVKSLLEKKAKVTVIVLPTTNKEKLTKNLSGVLKKIKVIKANLLDFSECLKFTKHKNIVLHFAALDGGAIFKKHHPAKLFSTNAQLTLNILEASTRNHVERLLLMSSIEVYPSESKILIKEEAAFTQNFGDSGYAWSKRVSEIAAKMYYIEYNLPVAIARVGNVYGPNDDKIRGRVIPTFIDKIAKGQPITIVGSDKQEKSFIYVSDLVRALLTLTERHAIADPVNIASEKYTTIENLAIIIGKLLKKKVQLVFEKKEQNRIKKRRISIAKAKKLLKFKESVRLHQGLKQLIENF